MNKSNFLSRSCISRNNQEEGDVSPKGTVLPMRDFKASDFCSFSTCMFSKDNAFFI